MTIYLLPDEPDVDVVWVDEVVYDEGDIFTKVTEWHRMADLWDDGDARELSWGQLLELGPVRDRDPQGR
jgi:hypothetical protein